LAIIGREATQKKERGKNKIKEDKKRKTSSEEIPYRAKSLWSLAR